MVVECISLQPTPELAMRIRPYYAAGRSDFDLKLGHRYVVLGLSLVTGVVWIDIPNEGGWPQSVPLELFRIVDPRCSRHWEARMSETQGFSLLPPALHEPDFASRVADDEPEAVARYHHLCAQIESEARI